jgi:hypothetical protein
VASRAQHLQMPNRRLNNRAQNASRRAVLSCEAVCRQLLSVALAALHLSSSGHPRRSCSLGPRGQGAHYMNGLDHRFYGVGHARDIAESEWYARHPRGITAVAAVHPIRRAPATSSASLRRNRYRLVTCSIRDCEPGAKTLSPL